MRIFNLFSCHKKEPKMPSANIIIHAPYTADKMIREYMNFISAKNKKALIIFASLSLLSCNCKLEKLPVRIEPVKIDSTKIKAFKVDSILHAIDERTKRTTWIVLDELPRLRDKKYLGNFTAKDKLIHDKLIKELKFILSDSSQTKALRKWNR